ncbi:MAG: EamA family transporter [Campylobacteraceae bacterium]|nr:EamA family transporter [Campylobacteraceae bacterium]
MSLRDLFIALGITFIWGINFSFIKMGLGSLNPFLLAGLRFMLCALPLVFFIKPPKVPFKYVIAYGLFFGVGLWGILYLGMFYGISAGVASIVLNLGVFFAVILSYFILKEKMTVYNKIAFILALAGIAVIFLVTDGTVTLIGMLFVILAAVSLAVIQIIVKKANTKEAFAFLIYSTLFPPIPLFIMAYLMQGESVFIDFAQTLDKQALISIAFQVYPTTLFGYWVWNLLLAKYPVNLLMPLSLLIPIFGLFGSYVLLGEEVGLYKVLACFIIVIALIINTFGEKIRSRIKIFNK